MKAQHILTLALLVAPAISAAQVARDTARIAPTVVTVTRTPLAATLSPASVSVISGEAMREQGIVTILDALKQVPGLSVVQTGSYGGATSVFIRGGESKYAKVLIDGVAVNDAGGSFDFSSLGTDNLDRVEIVRGPASVLYGSDAMAGVIQLFTRNGHGTPKVDISARAGEFNSTDGDASVRGSNGKFDYSFGGARHSTDGIQLFNSQYKQVVGSTLLRVRSGATDATFTARYSDNSLHYPTDGSGQVVDSNATRRDDRLSVGFDGGYRLNSQAELRLSLSSYDVHGITDDQPDSPGDKDGYYYTTGDRTYRRSGDLRMNIDAESNVRLAVGGQIERQWQASSTESNFGPNAFTARRRSSGIYGQALIMPTSTSTLTAGARLDHNETFGDFFTYRAAGTMELMEGTRIRGSVGTSFREPTFLENFGSAFVIGNAALRPEHALSFDAAVERDLGRATVIATYFSNSFRDLIDYKYSATAPNYNNIARTKTSGVELEGKLSLPEGFHADGSLTYLNAKVVDPGTSTATTATFSPGANLLRRPSHTIDAGVGYRMDRAGIDIRAHHVGVREDVYYAPDFSSMRVSLAPYTRADISADATILRDAMRTISATLRIENAFNENYTDVAGINYDFSRTDATSINASGYRAAARRTLVGMRVSF